MAHLARVSSTLSHSCQREFWQNESLVWDHQGSNPYHAYHQINAQPLNQFMFRDNSHNSIIMLSLNMIKHIVKIIINQLTNK